MALNASKCITVHTITIKNGTTNRQEYTASIPQALTLLFSFTLESRDCQIERDGDILLVAEHLSCGDLRQANFTGTSDDMKMLLWAKELFLSVHRWQERDSARLIESVCEINGYPIYRILTERRLASHGRERVWLIMLLACGIAGAQDHLRVIEYLQKTYRYTWAQGSTYREEDLASLLEWHLEDPTKPLGELIALNS